MLNVTQNMYIGNHPFGMLVPNRHASSAAYRYGFQGQEKDDELKGEGNSLNYKFRMHDPRVGRFFAVDPLTHEYPWYTPYSFSGNKVIAFVELEGLEEKSLEDMGDDINEIAEVVTSGKILEGPKQTAKDFLHEVKNISGNIENNIKKRAAQGVGTFNFGVQFIVDNADLKMGEGNIISKASRYAQVFTLNASGLVTLLNSRTGHETNRLTDNAIGITNIDENGDAAATAIGTNAPNFIQARIWDYKWTEETENIPELLEIEQKDTLIIDEDIKKVNSIDRANFDKNIDRFHSKIKEMEKRNKNELKQAKEN